MGVPKFFRYTSERYPCLNELVKQHQIPDFDNMYLDMNGIIHNCSHPDDSDPHFRITEEKIFKDVFHYIGILFQIIKPKKLFFMAIDGVAPRAKMNQQRGRSTYELKNNSKMYQREQEQIHYRKNKEKGQGISADETSSRDQRFRSAREAEKLEEQAKAKGETLPTEKRFDSNCITPGTVFMARLHEQLRYFVKHKMSTDPLWSKVKVILSGHETPGEGEHKIMDYIRWARCQPDYNPNTRHCLYGLDADLIMLGMCTHEPHFALLREEVKFGKSSKRAATPEETNFYLLHLSLLREYLEQEFIEIKEKLPFEFDIEKIVDDWVLMGFLVGNDFIPNLPNMHISNDMLPHLYKTYMTVLPTLQGYINEAGDLNLERFEIFMQELAKIDKEKFSDTYADLRYFEAKTGRRPNANERKEYKPNNDETFNVNVSDIKANKPDDELQALINATDNMYMDDLELEDGEEYDDTSDEEANIEMEFILHKKDYYMNKLDYSKVTEEVLADQAEGYVRAIQWNLHYYYRGCPSWCWFYPHHYAPYISDIKGFKDLKIEFELGEPFKPFEQLLAVLPSASKSLLPTPFHDLMTDEDSPIVHYYPLHFETDLNGKKNDWEAVVLIPFIDETNLLSAMLPCYQRLTEEELKRNSHGPMLVYDWTSENLGPAPAPEYFPTIAECHAIEKPVWRNELDVPFEKLIRGMLPNADPSLLYPGFPTMRHLKYKTTLKKAKVKVFDQPSRNDNMILEIIPECDIEPVLTDLARSILGTIIWVGWPHLTRAKVISVSNEKMRLHYNDKQNNNAIEPSYTTEQNFGNLHKQWISERATILEHNGNRLGIDLGDVKTIIHAVNLNGHKYVVMDDSRMVVEEQWCTVPCGYALQAVVRSARAAPAPPARYLTPALAYPPGDRLFLLTTSQYYGAVATVISSDAIRSGRIKVKVTEVAEPIPSVPPASARAYRAAHHAAAACGISTQMLSRITGTVFVVEGERNTLPTETQKKLNVGLNLKFTKKNEEVPGFTRKCTVTNAWQYSQRCIDLVTSYAERFPELFDKLAYSIHNDIFFESDLWPNEVGQNKSKEIADWLKTQPHHTAQRRECGSDALEPEEMKAVFESIERQLEELKNTEKNVTLHVKWNLLYKAELHEGNIEPDPRADFQLLDRVVCVGQHGPVRAGARGTLVAVLRPGQHNTVRLADKLNTKPTYHVMFDEPFPGGMTEPGFDEPRFYRMQAAWLLNVSFGRQLRRAPPPALGVTPLRAPAHAYQRSAFATYSPPREILSSKSDYCNNTTKATNGQPQETATTLLKNLLKISENDSEPVKQNKKSTPEQFQSWRSKNEQQQPVQQPVATKAPQQNWRKENHSNNSNRGHQQTYSNDWSNNSYKPPLIPGFGLFPGGGVGGGVGGVGVGVGVGVRPPLLPFPPPPAANSLLPPWARHTLPHTTTNTNTNIKTNQNPKPQTSSSQPRPSDVPSERTHQPNPFVPLQVQTSRRRVQNTGGSSSRKNVEPTPKTVQPVPQPVPQPIPQQQTSKPQKKKKPRIAANLPFQVE